MRKFKGHLLCAIACVLVLENSFCSFASQIQPTTPIIHIGENEILQADEESIKRYAEDLKKLEEAETETLSEYESEAGYQIIDGQKYTPEEIHGESYGEIDYEGVKPSADTGYVNFILNVPDYIHETAFVNVINLNTAKLYGCMTQEQNGFCRQICLPSGVYQANEGGLIQDTTGRFYIKPVQFNVKSGSKQDIIIEVIDGKPELEDQAYPESQEKEETPATKSADDSFNEPEAEPIVEPEQSSLLTSILTILFTVIPLSIIGIIVYIKRKKNKFGGFDN